MALATYGYLQTAVAEYLGRAGDTNIANRAGDIIATAEARIAYGGADPMPSRPLRIRAMEKSTVLMTAPFQDGGTTGGTTNDYTCTAGLASLAFPTGIAFTAGQTNAGGVITLNSDSLGAKIIKKGVPKGDLDAGDIVQGAGYTVYYDGTDFNLVPAGGVPLPTDYLQMRSIFIQGAPERQLSPITPEQYHQSYLGLGSGEPVAYLLEGDAIRFGPKPAAVYAVEMGYYKKFTALVVAVNWLLTNAPNVYLYGSLLEAAIFIGADPGIQRYYPLFKGAVDAVQAQNDADRYSGASLQMRPAMMGA